jgi:DNA-binding NarL/FixJ family response regulator
LDFGPGDGEHVAIRVAVIGDQLLVLQAVSATLRVNPDVQVVASDTGDAYLLRLVRETRPNVVILDVSVRVGDLDPVIAVETLKRACPTIQILALLLRESAPLWEQEAVL